MLLMLLPNRRLGVAQTKGGDAREFPIAHCPPLRNLLLARWRQRDGLFAFHRCGTHIGDVRTAWATACKKAGLPGRLVHELRRTAARDFRKQGVSGSGRCGIRFWAAGP